MTGPGSQRFYIETLGCPKNAVDSDKVVASLLADGLTPASGPEDADVVVVNTCAFIEAARQESVDTILALAAVRKPGAKLVVTGCLAERAGDELAAALPEVDAVVGFAGEGSLAESVSLGPPRRKPTGVRDLLELPRAAPSVPWAYVKIAEGCDRACAFCAIPSFRGKQRSRTPESIEAEVRGLVDGGVAEIVLVAQDLAWYGRDTGEPGSLAPLLRRLDRLAASRSRARPAPLPLPERSARPAGRDDARASHRRSVLRPLAATRRSAALLRAMKRWGSGERFLSMIESIRAQEPDAAFRSSFIVGFPGEDERQHDALLAFLEGAQLDWAGFFAFSPEDGTAAASLPDSVPEYVVGEWLRECEDVQEPITRAARDALVGAEISVLVDGRDDESGALIGRTFREAPEIDGVVHLDAEWARPGALVRAHVTDAFGTDLVAKGLP